MKKYQDKVYIILYQSTKYYGTVIEHKCITTLVAYSTDHFD